MYTDGAFQKETDKQEAKAGWGLTVLDSKKEDVIDYSGRVVLDNKYIGFHGAEEETNNTAELSAIINALWLIDHQCKDYEKARIIIRTDSLYSLQCLHFSFKNKNLKLIRKMRDLNHNLMNKGIQIHWKHINSHITHRWNDRADQMAENGKSKDYQLKTGQTQEKSNNNSKKKTRQNPTKPKKTKNRAQQTKPATPTLQTKNG